MTLDTIRPEPPAWAVEAGLPVPTEGETFAEYVSRIGLDPVELLAELTDKTAMLAKYRLESVLARHMPEQWKLYLRRRCTGIEPTPPLAETLISRARSHAVRQSPTV